MGGRGGGEGAKFRYSLNFETMSLLISYYCIRAFLCHFRSLNPSLCRLWPFPLSYVALSRPCRF